MTEPLLGEGVPFDSGLHVLTAFRHGSDEGNSGGKTVPQKRRLLPMKEVSNPCTERSRVWSLPSSARTPEKYSESRERPGQPGWTPRTGHVFRWRFWPGPRRAAGWLVGPAAVASSSTGKPAKRAKPE